jgi:hypothetical protein
VQPVADEGTLPINFRFMLAWESEEEMRERRAAAWASEAWQAAWAAAVDPATGELKYHLQGHSVLMRPLAHSPLH